MQRARRVALLVVLALVGALALTGCRSEPSAAIYVGSTTYTQKQVDKLADELKEASNFSRGEARHLVTEWIVVRDVAQRLVAEKQWAKPQVDLQETAQATGLPADAPLTKLYAEFQAYGGALQQHITPVTPTEADWADLYQRAQTAGLVDAKTPEPEFRQSLGPQNEQVFQANLGLRDLYNEAIKKADVVVNPKYGSEIAVLRDSNRHPLVVAPINAKGGKAAVVPAPPMRTQGPDNS
jgi:polyhydroxyalkanoate synthesis regulator phasin